MLSWKELITEIEKMLVFSYWNDLLSWTLLGDSTEEEKKKTVANGVLNEDCLDFEL